jgi:hypothetical protein
MTTAQQNPDLIARLKAAQNSLHRPVDIVTFGYLASSRAELERHVQYYEDAVANQPAPRKPKAASNSKALAEFARIMAQAQASHAAELARAEWERL